MPKITRLTIKNFRGISSLDVEVPPAGAVIKGGNAQGKTSVLRAIAAALGGEGLGPEAIRLGADQAEILIDVDALKIRRGITAKGSSLVVKNGSGDVWAKPQSRLTDLLGTSPLDPLAFFEADAKARRRMVLDTVQIKVTDEDIERWIGSRPIDIMPTDLHALLVVEQLRKRYYDARTEANRRSKDAYDALARARAEAPPEPVKVNATVEQAGEDLSAAERRRDEVRGRAAAADKARAATAATRERAAALRVQAHDVREAAILAPTCEVAEAAELARAAADKRCEELRLKIQELQVALSQSQQAMMVADAECRRLADQAKLSADDIKRADGLEQQAADLEASLSAVDGLAVSEEEIGLAEAVVEAADTTLKLAIDQAAFASYQASIADLAGAHEKAKADAERLDAVVKTLTDVAPRELAARADMIPGLAIADDGITLDGVAIDALSGAEQLRFAVELARRLNARSKILVVDGLERLDATRYADFVRFATSDGFQLLGTRVADGGLVVEAIESE